MGSLADFAAGAGKIFGATAEDMAAYAEYFTQAMAGNYRMLERKAGIHLTEAQQQVMQYGDDMQRALLIQDIVNLFKIAWGTGPPNPPPDVHARTRFFANVFVILGYSKMNNMIMGLVPAIQFIIGLVAEMIDIAFAVASVIMDNWGMIAPLIWGIAAAFAAWKLITIVLTIKKLILTAAILRLGKNRIYDGGSLCNEHVRYVEFGFPNGKYRNS